MSVPVVFFDNLLLSGTLTGSNESTTNEVRKVADGSINLPYVVSEVSGGILSGQVTVVLATSRP